MKKITMTLLALLFGFGLMAQNSDAYDYADGDEKAPVNINLDLAQSLDLKSPTSTELYNNGPLVNAAGTGAGGADESVLQVSLGLNSLGSGHQVAAQNWVADDFTITDPLGWDVSGFAFYAYQTGSTTTSTMTAVHFIIYDGVPGDPGTSAVFGDAITDRLTVTSWSNIYRVTETTGGSTNRPIMENVCDASFHLDAGTYWVVWQTDGSLGSGPWAPPITITGQASTGNAMQSTDDGLNWLPLDDGGHSPGLPFIISGDVVAPEVPLSSWPIVIGLLLISGFIVVRYKAKMA